MLGRTFRGCVVPVMAIWTFSCGGGGGDDPSERLSQVGETCSKSGDCDSGLVCLGAVCQQEGAVCPDDQECSGLECGPDPVCGTTCGTCGEGESCSDGECVACTPSCGGKECGDDGCGGSCGTCYPDATDGTYYEDTYYEDTYYEDTEPVEDNVMLGECTPGQSAGYTHVRIEDSMTNDSLIPDEGSDCQGGNPGADIDCIGIDRGGEYVAWAADVDYEPWGDALCGNDNEDPNTVLGEQDGIAQDGIFEGYFSLNGGVITLAFDGNEELLCGDGLYIVEMYNPNSPSTAIENYTIAFGDGNVWNNVSTDATGTVTLDVIWDW